MAVVKKGGMNYRRDDELSKEEFMSMALNLAENVAGQTSPNPPVGSVVIKNGRIVGIGAHLKAGERHAERIAVEMAGENAFGSDVYVTLEPCAHHGRTAPCADFLIEKGVRKVYVATLDPNPLVSGRGIEKLRNAGVEVEVGINKEAADTLYRPFFHFIQTKRPFVTIKTAVTTDGKIAAYTNDSKWITSEQARMDVHEIRNKHDAILVGINTVLNDNPLLTVRLPQGGKNPIRVILDTHLRTPLEANVLNGEAPAIIFCGGDAPIEKEQLLQSLGAEVIRLQETSISIAQVLKELGERNIMTLLVEGGAEVNGSFLQEQAFQQLILYMAPKIIGGKTAATSFGGLGLSLMKDALPLLFEKVEMIGRDIKITATVQKEGN
ncbi:bifunctional diaminohydroxyphosphoribosylaminopyrimidine deaminase/5-amino-6-(5-phosphoribosylamino)uracil reductase RibD [Heyndrickxia ginsengihumi]|uniref:bifunctional diaminohydroxyphosphoribosylaminopyrimidine deaminase/5-amino-6-(5-phosphoribosylamino)uracil reductase RibD n=1 Tax=Heyndrickxia ginsengihumi TaxID=363870 RepID=UPI0004BA177F|nr:bifunctional diaminohydroxyphosphoribosylaminopyrimidine deaminase/5-amino-6-(5-phosphoribosylamino)uracil reductase RibD [Heyndrickxia ginsengihumi]